jgi:hypothetical protein
VDLDLTEQLTQVVVAEVEILVMPQVDMVVAAVQVL